MPEVDEWMRKFRRDEVECDVCTGIVEQLVFSKSVGSGGMGFTTWTGNGTLCQECSDARVFLDLLET